MQMEKNQRMNLLWNVIDIIVLVIQLVTSLALTFLVKNMLPTKYWVIILAIFVILFLLMGLVMTLLTRRLQRKQKGKKGKLFVWLFSLILSLGLGIAYGAVAKGLDTLDDITQGGSYQSHFISILVKNDSEYEKVSDLNEKKLGILQGIDDKNTQQVLQELSKLKETSIYTVEYSSIVEIVDALLNEDVDAILFNEAYIAVMDEINENFEASIKKIHTFEILEKIEDVISPSDEISNEETDGIISSGEDFSEGQSEENTNESCTEETCTEEECGSEETQAPTQPPTKPRPHSPKPSDVTKESFTIFLSGMDKYGAVSSVSRSDVNMLVTINPRTRQILMTSIPRDYYVRLATKNADDKLTHAGLFGVQESVLTLENLFGIDIDYYVKVNFTSVVTCVNAVGGITVDNPRAFSTSLYHFPAGQIALDGNMALSFVRERHAFGAGDNERVKNQQRVLSGLIQKIISPAIITKYNSILSAMSGAFITDMTSAEIQSLIQMQLNDMRGWEIQQVSVIGTGSKSSTCYALPGVSVYVMIPNYANVADVANHIRAIENAG